MKLRLRRFDQGTIPLGTITLIQGRRNTGKSTILRSLMYALRDKVDYCVAMTPTHSSADFFRTVLPSQFVYDKGIDVGVIERALAMQRALVAKGKHRHLLLILDDVSYDKVAFRSPVIGDAWRNGRHANLTIMLTSQAIYDLPCDLRANTDLIFALRDPIIQNRRKLHLAYFGQLEFDAFARCFAKCTQDYGAIVLNQTVPTNTPDECLFWYRAQPTVPPFTLCSDAVWHRAERPPRAPGAQIEVQLE